MKILRGEVVEAEAMNEYLRRLIKDLKIARLGKGKYAQVFQHPTEKDVAVKVVQGRDKLYLDYTEWCQKNQSNKYAPKVYGTYPVNGENYHIVFLKKYKPFTTQEEMLRLLEELWGIKIKFFGDWGAETIYMIQERIEQGHDPDLEEIWRYISEGRPRNHIDLHYRNIMLDGKQLKFIDPLGRW